MKYNQDVMDMLDEQTNYGETKHVYRFTPSKKLDERSYQCANVEVFTTEGKSIGSYAWSRRRPNESDIQSMVSELIREYWTRKAWAK